MGSNRFIPLLLFLFAFGLRLIGITWGLPNREHYYSYHPDEWLILGVSYFQINLFAGEWRPGFYHYGSLPLYLFSVWLHLLSGWGLIRVPSGQAVEEVALALLRHDLHLWARVLVALFGAGTALVLYRIGQQLGGSRLGLVAGLVMAMAPAHVVHSRFQTVDVIATFFAALTFWAAVRLYNSPAPWREVIWGGIWAGCAAGCKYNIGLVLIALWVTLYYRFRGEAWRRHLPFLGSGATLISLLTFLIISPGSWADAPTFWKHFWFEVRHVQQGHDIVFQGTGLGWIYHLTPNLTYGFGLLPLLLGLAGWLLLWRAFPAARGMLVVGLLYYLLIGAAEVRFLRYTLPLYPALALGVGGWFALGVPSCLARLLVAVGFVSQSLWIAGLTACMMGSDPRDRCAHWFRRAVPPGETVAFAKVPWFYTPPLFPYGGELRWQDRVARLEASSYRLISLAPPDWNAERLQAEQPTWLILSEFEYGDAERLRLPEYERFMQVVNRSYRLQQRFQCHPFPFRKQGLPPHDLLYIYPEVRVYKRQQSAHQGFHHLRQNWSGQEADNS